MDKIKQLEERKKQIIVNLIQDYNGTWEELKKEKTFKDLMSFFKSQIKKAEAV